MARINKVLDSMKNIRYIRNELFGLLRLETGLILPPNKRLQWKRRAKLIREGKHPIKSIDTLHRYSITNGYLPRIPGRKNYIRKFGEVYDANDCLLSRSREIGNFQSRDHEEPIFSSYIVETVRDGFYTPYKKSRPKESKLLCFWEGPLTRSPTSFSESLVCEIKKKSVEKARFIFYAKTLCWVKKRKRISRKTLKVILLSNNRSGIKPYWRIFTKLPKKPYIKHFILSRKKRDELIKKKTPYGPLFFPPKKRCQTRRKALKVLLGYKRKKKKVIQKSNLLLKKEIRYVIHRAYIEKRLFFFGYDKDERNVIMFPM